MAVPRRDAVGAPTECAAVMLFEHGDPDALSYGVYPLPEAGPYDAVVDVYAIGTGVRWD